MKSQPLTIVAAASLLDMNPETLGRYCRRKVIKSRLRDGRRVISPEEVQRFKRERRGPGRPASAK